MGIGKDIIEKGLEIVLGNIIPVDWIESLKGIVMIAHIESESQNVKGTEIGLWTMAFARLSSPLGDEGS